MSPLGPTAVLYPPADPDELPVATLDWATGVVRTFVTYPHWEEIVQAEAASRDREDRYPVEALTHEATHLLQLSLTGYAYDLSCRACPLDRLADSRNVNPTKAIVLAIAGAVEVLVVVSTGAAAAVILAYD